MKTMIRLTILLVLLATASCTHKELCYDHPHTIEVEVVFDWSLAPDASPDAMALYVFPENGDLSYYHNFIGCKGGKIRLMQGRYSAVCLNIDTENVHCVDTDGLHTFMITSKDHTGISNISSNGSIQKNEGSGGERHMREPEKLWSHRTHDIEITKNGDRIVLYPEKIYSEVFIEILNAENLMYASGISATLSGLSEGHLGGLGQLSKGCATIPFGMHTSPDKTSLSAEIVIFGHCPEDQQKHHLTVYTTLADGTSWSYMFDVTEQMHDQKDPDNIHIILENLPIPRPESGGGGGLVPSIDDWLNKDIPIIM